MEGLDVFNKDVAFNIGISKKEGSSDVILNAEGKTELVVKAIVLAMTEREDFKRLILISADLFNSFEVEKQIQEV